MTTVDSKSSANIVVLHTSTPITQRSAFASATRDLHAEADHYVARARTMMARARSLVEADRQDTIQLLNGRRVQLARHFQNYQRFKHANIFNPIIEFGPPSSKVVARTMKIDCMKLGEVFGGYYNRWLGLQSNEWNSYRIDMVETVDMLAVHLGAELRAMRQLLMIAEFYQR